MSSRDAVSGSARPLVDYNPFDPAVIVDPVDYNALLRAEAPVHRDPHTGIFQIASYETVVEAVKQPEIFSNRFAVALGGGTGAVDPEVAAIAKQGWPAVDTMLTADPPEQKRFRSLVNKAFTPRRVNDLTPKMETLCDELIDAFAVDGAVELRSQFAVPLPLTVIAEQLGVPREDLPRFKAWADGFVAQLGQMADHEGRIAAAKLILEFQEYFAEILEQRRKAPQDDIISDVVNADVEGERRLDTAECLSILQQLLVAGNETTASAITEGMRLLATHPEERVRVEADPELIPNLVEEVLRLATPTSTMWRVVTSDTKLGGVEIPGGSIAMLRFASANRDESVFAEPARFDVGRANAGDHVSFGLGIHFCLGAQLARKEMQTAFRKLLERLPNARLSEAHGEPIVAPNILLRGLTELHLEFDVD